MPQAQALNRLGSVGGAQQRDNPVAPATMVKRGPAGEDVQASQQAGPRGERQRLGGTHELVAGGTQAVPH